MHSLVSSFLGNRSDQRFTKFSLANLSKNHDIYRRDGSWVLTSRSTVDPTFIQPTLSPPQSDNDDSHPPPWIPIYTIHPEPFSFFITSRFTNTNKPHIPKRLLLRINHYSLLVLACYTPALSHISPQPIDYLPINQPNLRYTRISSTIYFASSLRQLTLTSINYHVALPQPHHRSFYDRRDQGPRQYGCINHTDLVNYGKYRIYQPVDSDHSTRQRHRCR